MEWKQLLTSITGTVDEELRLRNAYLAGENRIFRHQITGRMQLTDAERKILAAMGQKLGKQALEEIATIAQADTILGWHRQLVVQKGDGSPQQKAPGRPRVDKELEPLVGTDGRRIAHGAMIALRVLWPTWAIPLVTKR